MDDKLKPDLKVNSPQKGALVGDEAVYGVDSPVETDVNAGSETAMRVAERRPDADTVLVHETAVVLDRVVTDPSSPEAVQIPDAGRGDLNLPIHALAGASTADERIAEDGGKAEQISDEDRQAALARGETVGFKSV
jgi:hypothetical protein